ncbi:hypothetical protein HanIR_Chr05g0232231 [Helianthus annuus]|nr:hypothetical protein HanIR_Chr05g0232231 [Helianthus annuus]
MFGGLFRSMPAFFSLTWFNSSLRLKGSGERQDSLIWASPMGRSGGVSSTASLKRVLSPTAEFLAQMSMGFSFGGGGGVSKGPSRETSVSLTSWDPSLELTGVVPTYELVAAAIF